jgi:hypothetical protein
MRKVLTTVVAVGILCATAGMAFAQEPAATAATQKSVIRLEERWLANENSPTVLDEILADDFVHVLPEGMISKKEHIDFVRAHPFGPFAVHKFERLNVRVYGNVAVATGVVLAIPADKGTPYRTLFTDVFAFRNGGWQAVNAQETPALRQK